MSLLSLLFPEHCVCCGEYNDTPLCDACVPCLPLTAKHPCPLCQKHTTRSGELCNACYGKTPLDGVFSATPYRHELVSRVLLSYKYKFARSLHFPLSALLAKSLLQSELPLPDILLPVPLHARRLRWRGFNQSTLLANALASLLLPNMPLPVLENTLLRIRATLPQAKTENRKTRIRNLKNAFAFFGDPSLVSGKRIWLVDDVATTNATLTECARVLKKKGAKEVWGIVVAG